jgi:dinuclear metal center YbgI/SA1388 family protein
LLILAENQSMKISEVISYLESIAPPQFQESYDNSGLLTGDKNADISGILICLDSTEDVIREAIDKKCNLVIAHHPIIFGGLKKITGRNYVERVVIKAIKNDIAIFACHTNLDNIYEGVNRKICEKLGLENCRILLPKDNLLKKLVTFCPVQNAEEIRNALFQAGAGQIGAYDHCSFNTEGKGSFRASKAASPYVGQKGEDHVEAEIRIETLFPAHLESSVLQALLNAHPYEEVAFDVYALANKHPYTGSGMIAELKEPMDELSFLHHVKTSMRSGQIRYSPLLGKKVKKIAVCGGAGSFLLPQAIQSGADVFVTSDYKYHQFFDADGKIIIADIGHYESEQFTKDLFYELITKKFNTFAVRLSEVHTNPVNYL